MRRPVIAAAGLAFATACGLANAASWSVFVEPGVYGRVAIGGYAEAPMVYEPQPVMVVDDGYGHLVEETVDTAYATDQPPVYLWVPEYQRLHWARYARDYGAYGVPVYFVDDGWYRANVMRRNWSPEQRSWSQQQWLDQDRLARDRFERQRFEQQRYEQQQRWNQQREWRDPRSQPDRDDGHGGAPGQWGRGQADAGGQDRTRWGSARGAQPQQGQPTPPPQSGQNGAVPRPQAGGQWQQQGGQWQQPGGQWPQRGGQVPQGGNASASQGNGGAAQQGNAGGLQANGGAPQGGGRGGWQPSGGAQSLQSPPASQARGGQERGRASGDRRGDERADGSERRSQGDARGGFERSHEGRRDR